MSYEIIQDLRYTRYFDNSDNLTWVSLSAAGKRGLSNIFYGNDHINFSGIKMSEKVKILLNKSEDFLGDHVPRPLEMADIARSLGETDKYLRILLNKGRAKRRYIVP